MKYEYCSQWNKKLLKPIELLSDEQARARFNGEVPEPDHWFTIVAFADDAVGGQAPEFYIELTPHAAVAKTFFVDQHGSVHFIYGFRLKDDRLFLQSITEYRYPDTSKFYRQNECMEVESFQFEVTGLVHRRLHDKSKEFVQESDIRDVDVSGHWEPVLKFGQWASLGRHDR